jgi:hypothetical protein
VITTRRGLFGLLPALAARKGRKVTPEYPVVSDTALLVPAINSPNFNLQNPSASPSPSWAILQNGLAYFFGLTIEGGGTFTGPDYIINPSGEFFYSSTPAFGNLVYSEASAAGTDSFGNAYLQGTTTYFNTIAIQQLSNEIRAWFALTAAGPYTLTGSSIAFGISPGSISIGGALGSIGGTVANPTLITTDPGTAASTFGTDWGASGSGANGAVFQLQPNGWVNVAIDVKTTAAAPAAEVCAIPAGYAPSASIVCGALLPTAGGGAAYPLTAFSTGTLQQAGVPGVNGVRYAGIITYPGPALSLP